MRPLVAVSCTVRPVQGIERLRLNQAYIAALEAAGVVPLVVPPLQGPDDVRVALSVVHGLVLTGGEDVDPSLYGEDPHPATHPPHATRDATELALLHRARQARLPTLAICRGVQLVNVALGGTLIQDIPSQVAESLAHDEDEARRTRTHDVRVTPGSRLAAALGATALSVNSIHHQALHRVADGLHVTARSDDGVIEGVEWTRDAWWMLGVQWHPEELVETPEPWDRQLFAAFAAECSARAARITRGDPASTE